MGTFVYDRLLCSEQQAASYCEVTYIKVKFGRYIAASRLFLFHLEASMSSQSIVQGRQCTPKKYKMRMS